MEKVLYIILFSLISFSVIGQEKYQQIYNSGFEEFLNADQAAIHPRHWNSFMTANVEKSIFNIGKAKRLDLSTDTRPGSEGNYSVKIYSTSILGIVANGNLTLGRMNIASKDLSNSMNYNYTDRSEVGFNHPFNSLPDSLIVWIKFLPKTAGSIARCEAYIHGDYNFKILANGTFDKTQVIATSLIKIKNNGNSGWQRISVPFIYDKVYGCQNPHYMLINLTTNEKPGGGSAGDELFIDDIELVYTKKLHMQDLHQTTFELNGSDMDIIIPFSITGAMYPDNIVIAQLSDAQGSFEKPINIGQLETGLVSGINHLQIEGKIPAHITSGKGYKIRLISSNYHIIGNSSSYNIVVTNKQNM